MAIALLSLVVVVSVLYVALQVYRAHRDPLTLGGAALSGSIFTLIVIFLPPAACAASAVLLLGRQPELSAGYIVGAVTCVIVAVETLLWCLLVGRFSWVAALYLGWATASALALGTAWRPNFGVTSK